MGILSALFGNEQPLEWIDRSGQKIPNEVFAKYICTIAKPITSILHENLLALSEDQYQSGSVLKYFAMAEKALYLEAYAFSASVYLLPLYSQGRDLSDIAPPGRKAPNGTLIYPRVLTAAMKIWSTEWVDNRVPTYIEELISRNLKGLYADAIFNSIRREEVPYEQSSYRNISMLLCGTIMRSIECPINEEVCIYREDNIKISTLLKLVADAAAEAYRRDPVTIRYRFG